MTDFDHDRWEIERVARFERIAFGIRPSPAPTLFELCVEAAEMTDLVDGLPDYREITRAVLGTVLDHTPSPYTVDELTRVLADAP